MINISCKNCGKKMECPSPNTVKEYVHDICEQLADWNNPDAVFYVGEWIDDYLDKIKYYEENNDDNT